MTGPELAYPSTQALCSLCVGLSVLGWWVYAHTSTQAPGGGRVHTPPASRLPGETGEQEATKVQDIWPGACRCDQQRLACMLADPILTYLLSPVSSKAPSILLFVAIFYFSLLFRFAFPTTSAFPGKIPFPHWLHLVARFSLQLLFESPPSVFNNSATTGRHIQATVLLDTYELSLSWPFRLADCSFLPAG